MVSSQVATDRPVGREVRGQITQNGDRWPVTKRSSIDQFPDEHLGAEREKQESTDQSSDACSSGSRVARS